MHQKHALGWSFHRGCSQGTRCQIFGCMAFLGKFQVKDSKEFRWQCWHNPMCAEGPWLCQSLRFWPHRLLSEKCSEFWGPDGGFFGHGYTSMPGKFTRTIHKFGPLRILVSTSSAGLSFCTCHLRRHSPSQYINIGLKIVKFFCEIFTSYPWMTPYA